MQILFGDTAIGHFLLTLISFIILMVIIKKFTYEPMVNMLQQRKDKIGSDLNQAASARDANQRMQAEAQQILANAKIQADQIVKDASLQGKDLVNKMKEQAQVDIAESRTKMQEELLSQKNQLERDAEKMVTQLAVAIAQQLLSENLTESDQKRLMDQAINRFEEEVHQHAS